VSVDKTDLFFTRIGNEILEILRTHDVPEHNEFSISSDILFSIAAALDDKEFVEDSKLKICSDSHESVYAFSEEWYQPKRECVDPHRTVFEVEIVREKGKLFETNFMAHWIELPHLFKEHFEVVMGCRSIDEVDQKIPDKIKERFERRDNRSGKVVEIRIKPFLQPENDEWLSFKFPQNEFGTYENSLDGLSICILSMAEKYA